MLRLTNKSIFITRTKRRNESVSRFICRRIASSLRRGKLLLFLYAPFMYQSDRVLRFGNSDMEMVTRRHSHASRRFEWVAWHENRIENDETIEIIRIHSSVQNFFTVLSKNFHELCDTRPDAASKIILKRKKSKKKKPKIIFRFLESQRFNCNSSFLHFCILCEHRAEHGAPFRIYIAQYQ